MRDNMHCDAIVSYRPHDYGFEPVYCGQVVGIRAYQSDQSGELLTIGYCAITGHEANVRRRFAEVGVTVTDDGWVHWVAPGFGEYPEDEPKSLTELMAEDMPKPTRPDPALVGYRR